MGIRASFEAVDRGRPIAEVAHFGLWYGCLAGLIGMLIGLVVVFLCRPWRSR